MDQVLHPAGKRDVRAPREREIHAAHAHLMAAFVALFRRQPTAFDLELCDDYPRCSHEDQVRNSFPSPLTGVRQPLSVFAGRK